MRCFALPARRGPPAQNDVKGYAQTEWRKERVFWACLWGLVVSFAAWQVLHLGGFRWDWDEGVYLLTARTVAEGYHLYSDIFSMAPPLFIASLNLGFWVLGETAAAGRAVIVLYSAFGLLGVGLLAREWGGRLAGLAAVLTLAAAPHFYILSRTVVADLPSMGVACLALWMAVRYERTGRRWWLAIAGLTLACGACLKLTAGLVAPAMIAAVLMRDLQPAQDSKTHTIPRLGQACLSASIMAVPFAMPFVACLLTHSAGPMIDQVVTLLWVQRDYFTPDYADNAGLLFKYLLADNFNIALNRGLTILGMVGGLSLAWRCPKAALMFGVWLVVILVDLFGYAPLWVHLFSPILFPLAVGAGVGIGNFYRAVHEMTKGHLYHVGWTTAQKIFVVALALSLGVYVYDWPSIASENARRGKAPGNSDEAMVEKIQAITAPGEYVITDEPLLAFAAKRPVPPDLCDCSVVRMTTERLSANDLIEATKQYRPAAVILGQDNRFGAYLSGYIDWVASHYTFLEEAEKGDRIYLASDRATGVKP